MIASLSCTLGVRRLPLPSCRQCWCIYWYGGNRCECSFHLCSSSSLQSFNPAGLLNGFELGREVAKVGKGFWEVLDHPFSRKHLSSTSAFRLSSPSKPRSQWHCALGPKGMHAGTSQRSEGPLWTTCSACLSPLPSDRNWGQKPLDKGALPQSRPKLRWWT